MIQDVFLKLEVEILENGKLFQSIMCLALLSFENKLECLR